MVTTTTGSTGREQQAAEATPLLAGTDSNISSSTKNGNNSNVLNMNERRKRVSFHGESLDSNGSGNGSVSVDDNNMSMNMNMNINSDLFVASWRDTDISSRSEAGTSASASADGCNSTTATPNNSLRSASPESPSISRSFLKNHYTQSNSQRERALSKEGVGAAAFLIRDVVLGEMESHDRAHGVYDPYQHPEKRLRNNISIASRRLTSYRPLLHFMRAVTWTLVLLTFIEPPAWCRETQQEHAISSSSSSISSVPTLAGCPAYFAAEGIPADNSNSGSDSFTDKIVSYYPNSGALFVTGTQSIRIEAVCLAFIGIFVLLRLGRDGMSPTRYFRAGHSGVNRTVQFVSLVLLTVGLLADYRPHHPVTRLVLLATILPGCQRDLQVLIHMLPEIFNVLALLTIMITFYAWFGTVMFVDTVEGSQHFSNLVESMWTLYICVTTANYPDVMMPIYNENRWAALYFVSFMVVTFFFLMNVILASVVNEYDTAVKSRQEEHVQASTDNLKKAYQLMDVHDTGRIDQETVMALFWILNEDFPEFRTLSEDNTKLLFAILDKDGSSTITEDEFMDFGNVLLLEFTKESDYQTFVEVRFPNFFRSEGYQWFCRVVKSNMFEHGIDAMLVMNAIVIGIQSYPELSGEEVSLDLKYWDGSIDTVWEYMESVFTLFYCVEVVVKVTVNGWKAYHERQKNLFDFTITVLAVLSSAYVYYPNDFSDSRLVRLIVMARVLRLIRLLTAMKRFQLIGMISAEILPEAASVMLVLFFLMYFFAALGMQLYGGLVTRDPNNPLAYLILDTDFSDNGYWANNFNDMFSGMNVLFNLLVINNWTECEVGYEAVTESKWVRLYFLGFHILGVVLVNNLVIAFIITSFLQQLAIFRERTDEEVVGNGEAVIRDRRAVFDASTVTGTKTSLSGGYIARLRKMNSDPSAGHDQDRLRRLFTVHSSELKTKGGESLSSSSSM